MSRKKKPVTPAQRAAGRRNIVAFNTLHGSRQGVTHGVHTVLASGGREMPPIPGAAEIAESVDAVVREMVTDLGCDSEAELPAQKRAIVKGQRLCLLVIGLASNYLQGQGLLDRRSRPHPLLKVVGSFVNTLRLNALALGLERRPRKVGPTTIAEYLESPDAGADARS
jgi:hypothetical protein